MILLHLFVFSFWSNSWYTICLSTESGLFALLGAEHLHSHIQESNHGRREWVAITVMSPTVIPTLGWPWGLWLWLGSPFLALGIIWLVLRLRTLSFLIVTHQASLWVTESWYSPATLSYVFMSKHALPQHTGKCHRGEEIREDGPFHDREAHAQRTLAAVRGGTWAHL